MNNYQVQQMWNDVFGFGLFIITAGFMVGMVKQMGDNPQKSHQEKQPIVAYLFYSEFPYIDQLTQGKASRCLKDNPSYRQWFEFLEIYYKIGLEKASQEEINWGFYLISNEIPQIEYRFEQIRVDYPEEIDAYIKYEIPELKKAITKAYTRADKVIAMDYFAFQQHSAAGIDPRWPLFTFGVHEATCGLNVIIEVLQKMREERPPKDIWTDEGVFE